MVTYRYRYTGMVWCGGVWYGSNPAISCVCAAGFYLCSPVVAGKTEKQVITATYFDMLYCYIAARPCTNVLDHDCRNIAVLLAAGQASR